MNLFGRATAVAAVLVGFSLVASPARADTFTLGSVGNMNDPFGQCHNSRGDCGGIQIDWDGLGFDAGNPHGALHINNLKIGMTTQTGSFGGLTKQPGNVTQFAAISLSSGAGATFTSGPHTWSNILSMSLTSVGDAEFRGKQLRPLDQNFVLRINTTTGAYVFDLCSIQGSEVNFARTGAVTAVNFRFCGTLVSQPGGGGETPPPGGETPPPVPEPTCLLLIGVSGLGLVRGARRKLLAA